jgi:hypothetical protein
VAFSSAGGAEQVRWREAARREAQRYGIAADDVEARMEGRQAAGDVKPSRGVLDWLLVIGATGVFVFFAAIARVPQIFANWGPALVLAGVLLMLLFVCGRRLWRTTGFQ